MLQRTVLPLVTVFCLAAVLSVAASYGVFRYKAAHPVPIGEPTPFEPSQSFITPFNVFGPGISLDVKTGKVTQGTFVDYAAAADNAALWFLPLAAIYLMVRPRRA